MAAETASSHDSTAPSKRVLVTGANGYLGSHIVNQLLSSGHSVHACVRDASRESSVAHLKSLPGAEHRLHLFSVGDLAQATDATRPFDKPMKQCHAVIHSATPLSTSSGSKSDGEAQIFDPAMTSTREILTCIERNADTVQCLVLTSSMSAVAPRPEPAIKDESHWSDSEAQKAHQNWYGATKTCQEQMVREWVQTAKCKGTVSSQDFVYAAICPTVIVGPGLRESDNVKSVGGTMGNLVGWLQGGMSEVPNDSMSFIHVDDCAKMHARILSLTNADINPHKRYMNVIESLHWNDIMDMLKELYPPLPDYKKNVSDKLAKPTQFNLNNMKSLGVPHRSTRETLEDSIRYLREMEGLD